MEAMPPLEELVAAVVRSRSAELAARRDGREDTSEDGASETRVVPLDDGTTGARVGTSARVPTEASTCHRCGETKPPAAFPPGRNVCRACKYARARAREARTGGDEEPRPAGSTVPLAESRNPLALVGAYEAADLEARRELLDELRANGVELELRDGREFHVLRVPDVERYLEPRMVRRHDPAELVA